MRLDATVSRPTTFVGRWARLVSDTAWTDTVELFADGGARGWSGRTEPDGTRWDIVHSRVGGDGFCAGPPSRPNCQPYRLEGDTLVLGRLPKQTFLRRVHE